MSVLLDTGPLTAFLNRDDPLHAPAAQLMEQVLAGAWGTPVSTDFVLDEGLTLLRRRPGRRELSEHFARLFLEPAAAGARVFHTLPTTDDLLRDALKLHVDLYDRKLSFTDCTLIVHARRMDAVVATFDRGFHGLVPTIPS